jgi:TPR repeat protein
MHICVVFLSTLVLVGCAGLNPNVGTRTADEAYKRGDCATALGIYQKNAEEGKPWAQLRLGSVYYEGRCLPKNEATAMAWLKKSGSYVSKTDWENGKEFSTGEAGYFNTRVSSSSASRLVALMYSRGAGANKDLTKAWLWTNRGLLLANPENKAPIEAEKRSIEALMSDKELSSAKRLAESWSPADDTSGT